jgi:hypothetical protein
MEARASPVFGAAAMLVAVRGSSTILVALIAAASAFHAHASPPAFSIATEVILGLVKEKSKMFSTCKTVG